eukprot:3185259-Alexandrium_andersonii.AAC.1
MACVHAVARWRAMACMLVLVHVGFSTDLIPRAIECMPHLSACCGSAHGSGEYSVLQCFIARWE